MFCNQPRLLDGEVKRGPFRDVVSIDLAVKRRPKVKCRSAAPDLDIMLVNFPGEYPHHLLLLYKICAEKASESVARISGRHVVPGASGHSGDTQDPLELLQKVRRYSSPRSRGAADPDPAPPARCRPSDEFGEPCRESIRPGGPLPLSAAWAGG